MKSNPEKTKKRVDKSGVYNDIPYESDEELAFLQWAFEVKEMGYITQIQRAGSTLLSPNMDVPYAHQLKTKTVNKTQTVLKQHIYTPEFVLHWADTNNPFVYLLGCNEKFEKPFIAQEWGGLLVSIIEVKPMFDQNNMERLFKINQKWMWEKHSIFINLVKPQQLFEKTFTPQQFLLTKTGKIRTIKWVIKPLNVYLKEAA